MFHTIFFSVLKVLVIPIGFFFLFKDISIGGKPIGENYVFLAVTIALTFSGIFSTIFKLVKILPNIVLLRGHAIFHIIIKIIIEISSIIGFWLYYLTNYAK